MKRVRFISIIVLSIVILSAAHAEVPLILNYQGQVNDVDGLFTGDGYFKFAIVDQAGSTAFWKNVSENFTTAAPDPPPSE